MKPLILLSPDEVMDKESYRGYYMQKRSYTLAVSGAGGNPMMPVDGRLFREYAQMADGLILTDGSWDINPARYGELVTEKYSGLSWYGHNINYFRDSADITLCQAFMELGKPVLGIGRGMHIINVVLGGTLYWDITETTGKLHPEGAHHKVSIAPESKLAKLLGEEAEVNSFHHQAIKDLGKGLKAAATSPDGFIEAIEHESLPVFGVQWNPETYMQDDEYKIVMAEKMIGDIKASAEEFKNYLENGKKTMNPLPGIPTDAEAPHPTDNPIFNHFVALCRKEA